MSTVDVIAQLRATAPSAPESLRARVLALEPQPRRWQLTVPSRRLALVVLPVAAALAVTAAVIHGLTGSSAPRPVAVSGGLGHVRSAVHFGAVTNGAAPVGAPTLSAGSGSVAATPAPVPSSNRLQHTDASLEVRVADASALSHATSAAVRIATSLGGYAQSVQYRTPQEGGGASTLVLRVPAQNVKEALARLAGLGTVVSQELSVTDLQQRFATQSAQIAQLRRTIAALVKAIADPTLPDAQRVLLRIRLAESRRALSERLHARKGTVNAGTTAQISLVLATQQAIVPVAHHRGRLGRMVHSAIGFLGLEATIVLYALIVAAPLALLAALAWYLARLRRRREADRLLAA